MPAWALMDLKSRISSKDDISGVEIAATIDGNPCQILFPRLPKTLPRVAFDISEPLATSLPSMRHPASGPWDIVNPRVWGGYSYNSDSATLHLSHLGIRFDDQGAYSDAKLLAQAATWRNHLLDWLPALHGRLPEIIEVYEPVMWLEQDPDIVPTFYYDPPNPVDLETWRHAAHHASAGHEVPLTLLLLYRAVKSMHEADYRQAVVDASTAFELALHAALKRAIDNSDEQRLGIAGAVLKSLTLGRMISLATSLGIWIPEDCGRRVTPTRNSTLHNGLRPNRTQTMALLSATAELMFHYESLVDYANVHCKHELPDYVRKE